MKHIKIYDKLPMCAIDIRKTVFVDEQGFLYDIDDTDSIASHIVMFDGERAIATCRVFKKQEPDVYMMGRLAVLKEYRGQGLGTEVLSAAERHAHALGGSYLCMHAQYQARGFYAACGYSEYGEIEYEQDAPHIWMAKKLT
ncbi:MAG: GNAT family N-acetyltransferase [Clostridia bacterium]|nr:GNAT family N-acetyltransferase [Clostridia bacterium]